MASEKTIEHLKKVHASLVTHGMSKHRISSVWQGMKQRCHNPNNPAYKYYGGRGIFVCDSWRYSLANFINDMGIPEDGMTIDRIDNDRGYEPDNCRWVTRATQQSNRRNNHFIEYNGKRQTAMEWASELGIAHQTVYNRIELGWNTEQILCTKKQTNLNGLSLGKEASALKKKARTHCKYGHEFTPENTGKNGKNGRSCRKCRCIKQRAYILKKQQLQPPSSG